MQARQFEQFLLRLPSLTRRQRGRLLALLQSAAGLDRALDVIEQPGQTPCCPRCQADRPYRHGHANGLQRYRCRICFRTFNALSGTPLARLRHKSRWIDYLDGMLDSRSVRRTALETGVASATSFRWRHRQGCAAQAAFVRAPGAAPGAGRAARDRQPRRLSGIRP